MLWSVEASLHIYKRLYLWNLWIEYEVLGCLVVFPFQKFSKKVFTLHAHIIFRWLTTCYQREELCKLFTSLHASSNLVTLWFRLSQTKKVYLAVKACEDLWRPETSLHTDKLLYNNALNCPCEEWRLFCNFLCFMSLQLIGIHPTSL